MSDDRDSQFWFALERRVSDMDSKLSIMLRDYQRDYTELSRDIKENTARVNNGLSPSIQKAIQDNADNKLMINTLTNTFEKDMVEMKSIVRETADLTRMMIDNFDNHKLKPVETELDYIKKTFIYGAVGIFVVFFGQMGMRVAWDKIFKGTPAAAVESIVNLKSIPMKK